MERVPLSAVPNQAFNIAINSVLYGLVFKFCINIMTADIVINRIPVILGMRLVPGTPLIPFKYLENGNFILLSLDGDYADYTKFGVSQALIYATQDELNALRGA